VSADLFSKYLLQPVGIDDRRWEGGTEDAASQEELDNIGRLVRLGRPLFDWVAGLADGRDAALLTLLYSGRTRLHAIIGEDATFRNDNGFADRAGGPFRAGESSAVHAVRALAGLGLALAVDAPAGAPLRSALAWYAQAQGSLAVGGPDLASIASGQPRLTRPLELLAGASGDDGPAGAALAAGLTLRALAAGPGGRDRWTSVVVLLARSGEGVQARLKLSVARGLPPGLVPAPEQMSLFAADQAFQRALDRAWAQAGGRVGGTVLWSVEELEGPSPCIDGESAGAAFAVALDELRRISRPMAQLWAVRRLQSDNAVVGRIDDLGYLQGVEGYQDKLDALGKDARVIVPVADTQKARTAARDVEIVPAAHWKDAARQARRANGKVVLRQAVAVAAAGIVAAGLVAWGQHRDAAAQQEASLSGRLAALAVANVGPHLDVAQLLAVEATRLDNTPQARAALFQVATAMPDVAGFLQAGGNITALAVSADGRHIVAGTSEGHVVDFDLVTGARSDTAPFGGGAVSAIVSVSVSASGTTLAAADEATAVSWHPGGKPVPIPAAGSAYCVALSPSGVQAAVLSTVQGPAIDNLPPSLLTVRNLSTGRRTSIAPRSTKPDGTTTVPAGSAPAGGGCIGSELAFRSESDLMLGFQPGVYTDYATSDLRVTAAISQLVTATAAQVPGASANGAVEGLYAAREISDWQTGHGSKQATLLGFAARSGPGPAERPAFLTFSDDGKYAAAVSGGSITIAALAPFKPRQPLGHATPVQLTAVAGTTSAAFIGDSELATVAGSVVELLNLGPVPRPGMDAGLKLGGYQTQEFPDSLSISPDGRYLAVQDVNSPVPTMSPVIPRLDILRTGPAVTASVTGAPDIGMPVWSADQLLGIWIDQPGSLVEVKNQSGTVLGSWPLPARPSFYYSAVRANSSGQLVIAVQGAVITFDPKTRASTIRTIEISGIPHTASKYLDVRAISPDGADALVAGYGGLLDVNLQTGAARMLVPGSQGVGATFAGGRLFLQTGNTPTTVNTLQEWNDADSTLLSTIPLTGERAGFTVSPDGSEIAQVSSQGVVSVSDAASGQVIASFPLPPNQSASPLPMAITTTAISPDNRYLYTATPGGGLTRFDIGESDLISLACHRAGYSLTPAIWSQFVQAPPPSDLSCPAPTAPAGPSAEPAGSGSAPATSGPPATPGAPATPTTATAGPGAIAVDISGAPFSADVLAIVRQVLQDARTHDSAALDRLLDPADPSSARALALNKLLAQPGSYAQIITLLTKTHGVSQDGYIVWPSFLLAGTYGVGGADARALGVTSGQDYKGIIISVGAPYTERPYVPVLTSIVRSTA
jgi:hypothetical protein